MDVAVVRSNSAHWHPIVMKETAELTEFAWSGGSDPAV